MRAQPLTVEVDIGSASSWGRQSNQAWLVRLRRADRSIIVAIGLSRTAADSLAERIAELVRPDPADTPARPAQRAPEVGPTG
jgi:hypothetical protein